jgi:primosomal protein N' (replication factor Y)
VGSLVSVPFHGRTVQGWILGPAAELPEGKLLSVRQVRSPIRFFDRTMLALLQWVSDRYIVPLSVAIQRSYPPRVAGEEAASHVKPVARGKRRAASLALYGGGAVIRSGVTTWLRPLPDEEASTCLEAVETCLASGSRALVLVPEADPLPETARALLDEFGDAATLLAGGDARQRYRTWLDIRSGARELVIGTRPAVFAPMQELGLIWVSREVHPGHREDRAPYYHVRDVAAARARLEGSACVLSSLSPSVETALAAARGVIRQAPAPRAAERAAAPLVETTRGQAEGHSPRLASLLRVAESAVLIDSRTGYGIARVCRACGEPAACTSCGGPIVMERGAYICRVCGARGSCANCSASAFGIERGGTERIAEWVGRRARAPVALQAPGAQTPLPGAGRIVVGTAAMVKDLGVLRLELVAILDPDRALVRPGLRAGERALATWMEAAAWAGPRQEGGRVLVQTRRPSHPAIQALVRWDPMPFLLREAEHRREAGFPPGHPVFRVYGPHGLGQAIRAVFPSVETLLATPVEGGTVCLVVVPPGDLPVFRLALLGLVRDGGVSRIEAEPQL